MQKIISVLGLYIGLFLLLPIHLHSQNEPSQIKKGKLNFTLETEFVSRYVWRGIVQDLDPHLQGSFITAYKGFSFDIWASSGITSSFSEINLTMAYSTDIFTLALVDYFVANENSMSDVDFFNIRHRPDAASNHTIEALLILENFTALPFTFTAGTFIYGDDRDADDQQQYSSYFEMAYLLERENFDIRFFIGGTAFEGAYADKATLTNIGLRAVRNVRIGKKLDLGLSSSLVINPDARHVYVILGIGL